MQITEELLETIFKRAMQYSFAKYGREPNLITIEDGYLELLMNDTICEQSYSVSVESLTEDLNKVYDDRMKAEAEERKKEEIKRQKEKELEAQQEKIKRRTMYERLKKEFGE